ncbi:Cellulose synthase-like protein H1, partial [Mucuna pruriens]
MKLLECSSPVNLTNFANQHFQYIMRGMAGLQGPYYSGTNAFHRRNAIYGLFPHEIANGTKGKIGEKILIQQFGSSKEFLKSTAHALDGIAYFANDISPSNFIEAAIEVAGCGYEYGTFWGKKIGWMYGSISEDVPTGLNIQRRGWRSECCTPDPIAFTGCAPRGLPSTMIQQKRWASGLTVVFFGKHSPVMGMLFGKIQFRAGLSYFWLTNWGLRGIFQLCYAVLPPFCIITNTSIFPKGPSLWIPIALLVIYNVHTLLEYHRIGLSIRYWWNNQRMSIITTTSAWFIGFLSGVLKLSGISDTVFEITQKEQPTCGADGGRFTFDKSPVFVVGTTILLVQLIAMLIKFLGLQPSQSGNGCGLGEFIASTYVIVCYWPYFKGLFGRGKYGIPLSTMCKSVLYAFLFFHFCTSNRRFQRVIDTLILLLLLLLLSYRVFSSNNFTFPWFLAFICESWFTFTWIVILNAKWSPAITITHPDRLLQRVPELPPVDLFVTTADPVLEPPIITLNTVLSVLALDYPTNKLACYVSDDGCSPLTFYALVEASKFAKFWVPFCNKYNVQLRAPFRYFSHVAINRTEHSLEFQQEWLQIKDMYDNLSQKIEAVTRKTIPFQLDGEFAVFSNTEQRNHPSIIKVILERDGLPQLIYISREKRPQYHHNYKAGAMNVLTRVSGLMTNAPFMLNVDCDMVVNNPKIVLHALCILMDSKFGKEVAFVQCFQQFYDGMKDDPFGNQWVSAFEYIIRGMGGLQGPFYGGTNTFHRRNAIYGLYPHEIESGRKGKLEEKILIQQFGSSEEFTKSAANALEGSAYSANDITPSNFIEAATQVANCDYEYSTYWGKQIGWLYGSISEDVPTGLNIQKKGWRSECCTPDPIAFTGCAPGGLLSTMIQQKRWASGLTVVFFGKHSPVMGMLFGKIQFRAGLSYFWLTNWGLRGFFLVSYVALLPYCIITNTIIFPKGLGLWIPIALFLIYNVHTLLEYLTIGLSLRHWWNNQRMCIIRTTTASFIGFISAMLKLSGISDTVFEITEKKNQTVGADSGRFTFDESPVIVAGTTILLVHLTAMLIKFWDSKNECGLGEFMASTYVVVCYWPYFKGLFGRGKYGIPLSTMCRSAVLAFVFLHFCSSNTLT